MQNELNLNNVQWVPVADHPNYEISNSAFSGSEGENLRIRRMLKTGRYRYINGHITDRGYRGVILDGKNKKFHRLVLESFDIKKPAGRMLQVNHLDHDKDNNVIANLEWTTPQKNTEYLFKKKGKAYHGKPVKRNLDIYEYLEYQALIVGLIKEGYTRPEIRDKTGYSLDTVEYVRKALLRGIYKKMYWNCYRRSIGLPAIYNGYDSGKN